MVLDGIPGVPNLGCKIPCPLRFRFLLFFRFRFSQKLIMYVHQAEREKKVGEKSEKMEAESRRTEDSKHVEGRHTHESGDDSDKEELPKARLRPRHVVGGEGLAPPLGSALGRTVVAPAKSAVAQEVTSKAGAH